MNDKSLLLNLIPEMINEKESEYWLCVAEEYLAIYVANNQWHEIGKFRFPGITLSEMLTLANRGIVYDDVLFRWKHPMHLKDVFEEFHLSSLKYISEPLPKMVQLFLSTILEYSSSFVSIGNIKLSTILKQDEVLCKYIN